VGRILLIQHIEHEGPGLFQEIAEKRGYKICTYRLDLGDSLPELTNGDLLLVLGGPMGIRDIGSSIYPWLRNEVDLIKEALLRKIGVIGVCLGAQLLAYAAGGDVETLQGGTPPRPLAEIGWNFISSQSKTKINPLTVFLESPLPVLHWHGDRILLPTSAELIASSSRCKEQMFMIGSKAVGLQFHIEIDNAMVYRWIEEDKNFISSALGNDAQSILKKEQQEYCYTTLEPRFKLINLLFDLLI
tara:strand:- start:1357 stop:2088 length:732 start_codon:yes stop_codon:yes gene_type:complete